MTFIEDLRTIIPIEIGKQLFNFVIKLDYSQKKRAKPYEISKDEKLVTIFVKNLSPKEDRHLKKAIKTHFDSNELLLIEESKTALLNRLYQYNDVEDNQILSFFKPVLSSLDWQTLRDSLFLRNEFRNHHQIGVLKSEIISRYGERGNVISNMCTAGYFEE